MQRGTSESLVSYKILRGGGGEELSYKSWSALWIVFPSPPTKEALWRTQKPLGIDLWLEPSAWLGFESFQRPFVEERHWQDKPVAQAKYLARIIDPMLWSSIDPDLKKKDLNMILCVCGGGEYYGPTLQRVSCIFLTKEAIHFLWCFVIVLL